MSDIVDRILFLLLIAFICVFNSTAQCPNDLCENAIEAFDGEFIHYSTLDCTENFLENEMDDRVHTACFQSCHDQNYDNWVYFKYPTTGNGFLRLGESQKRMLSMVFPSLSRPHTSIHTPKV